MKYLLALLLLCGCNVSSEVQESPNPYKMNCVSVNYNLVRCENIEAICYGGRGNYTGIYVYDAVNCKFKKE
jgi:hypothetical protein